jgi:hypothetical protein
MKIICGEKTININAFQCIHNTYQWFQIGLKDPDPDTDPEKKTGSDREVDPDPEH